MKKAFLSLIVIRFAITGHLVTPLRWMFRGVFQMSAGAFMILAIRPRGPKTRRGPNGSI